MKQVVFGRVLALRLALIGVMIGLASAQLAAPVPPAAAQGTATIEITNIDTGSGQPAPFTRFQVTSENGTVYGPMETDLNGYVAFSVTVDPQGTSFTVEEETPPACATAPDPQTTAPLQAGDSASLSFSTQDNPGCGLGTIALYAMACPDGFSGPAGDYGPWRDGCTGTNDGAGFTLTSVATGDSWNPIAGEYGIPGRAPVNGLPAGDYTFQQNGETPSAVFCLVYDTANYATSAEPSSVLPVPLTDGIGTVSLTGNRVSCDVFSVPGGAPVQPAATSTAAVEPAAGATLDIHLAACPPGYLAGDTIYGDCHGNGVAGQPVQVSADNGFAGTIGTALPETPGPGVASFTGLADGTYTVTTNVPENTTIVVYCTDANDAQVPGSFDDPTESLTVDLAAGDIITCDWYELPAAEVQPAGTSSIEVHAARCPDGTDPNGELYDACHANGMDGMTYSVSGPNGYSSQQTTTLPDVPGPGAAIFGDLTGGTYTVTQENADPGSIFTMYCSLANADDVVPFAQVDNATISFDLPDDTGVVCDFYTIPAADQATTLQVTSYRCPLNMVADETWTLDDFLAVCEPSPATTQFTLTPDGGEGVTLTTGSAGVGTVLFEGLPTGAYQLGSSIPGDFNEAYPFCGLEGGTLEAQAFTIDIDASLGPYVCQWFNDGENASGYSDTLTVTSLLCPPGTDSNYAEECGATPLSGGTISLTKGNFSLLGTVAEDGTTTIFDNLTMGDYQLTSLPPSSANVAVYVVSCEGAGGEVPFDYDDSDGMRISVRMPGGVNISCNWYNIPPSTPTVTPNQPQGAITVHKFLCQGKSVDDYNWDADCSAESNPIGFSLKTADGRPIAVGTTNSSGVLTYTNLANGAYSLDETSGDWCRAESDRVDSAGNVLVAGGGNTDVYIYNCSLKNVGTLPSTGTGADRPSAGDAGFDAGKLWQLVLAASATLGIALAVRHQLQRAAVQSPDAVEDTVRTISGEEPVS